MARPNVPAPPVCPFCESPIDPPVEVEPKRMGDFAYGRCGCGAVYVCDVTGHNLGAAFVEALGFSCNDDWDLAWSLMPDEDYQDTLIEDYDLRAHRVYPSGRNDEGQRVRGVLTFLRPSEDLREVKGEGVRARLQTAASQRSLETARGLGAGKKSAGRRFKKSEVQAAVAEDRLEELGAMAVEDPLVLHKIQRLLYSADIGLRWKAVLALGHAAGFVAMRRPGVVGELIRRLLNATKDSAASSWGAVEALGEILRHSPETYGSFLRHVIGLVTDRSLRASVCWAVGRIAEVRPDLVRANSFFVLFELLGDPDPAVRGHAAWAIGRLRAREAESALSRLVGDEAEVPLFDGERLRNVTVGTLASEALAATREETPKNKETDMKPEDQESPASESSPELARAEALYQEGEMARARGMSLDALSKLEEALAIFETLQDEARVANACEKLADLHMQRGNFKGARPMYQRALAVCEKKGDAVGTVFLAEKVIDVYRAMGEVDKALPYYIRALELVEDLQDAGRAALYLTGIGDIYQGRGLKAEALEAYRLALKIYSGMGAREKAEILAKGIETLEGTVTTES